MRLKYYFVNMTLEISSDEALVLFSFLSRWDQTQGLAITDEAEAHVLWNLQAELERHLAEPFSPDYPALLQQARSRLKAATSDE
ncbi:MAG TPA: hypothetical protein VM715_11880 [Candidatus Acidoferrum sp.]|nr:hypothetical protein [Candidatus Acidoferrum sp.]